VIILFRHYSVDFIVIGIFDCGIRLDKYHHKVP
jgi:hypothetical protein